MTYLKERSMEAYYSFLSSDPACPSKHIAGSGVKLIMHVQSVPVAMSCTW